MSDDRRFMLHAFRLALRGIGSVEPNPAVGCLIVSPDNRILAQGWHARFGGPHAEAAALATLPVGAARGATAYVTLEPCAHHGKTPPCAQALIDAGIARCVIGRLDPNPQAAGGADALRAAGITVELLELPQTRLLTAAFTRRITAGLPWVTVKWAQTLDGRIATRTRDSKWLSNERSRASVHRRRARADAVITGIGTLLADDPMLTPRIGLRRRHRPAPLRCVIDPHLATPLDARLVATAPSTPTLIAFDESLADHSARNALADAGVTLLPCTPPVELALLKHLAEKYNATRVLVEAGGGLVGRLLQHDLIDEIIAFITPRLLGDIEAVSVARGLTVESIAHATPLRLIRTRHFGDDLELIYHVQRSP